MPPKPQFKNTYNIGRAKALKDKVITDPNDPNYKPPDVPVAEPRASYKHTLSSSMILSEEGTQYTIVSKLAIIPAHRRYVKADPDGDTERKRTDHVRYGPEDDMIYMTITDGETAWEGHIDYAKNNINRLRPGGKDDTWTKHKFLTMVIDAIQDPIKTPTYKFFCHIEEINGPLMFLIKQVGAESGKVIATLTCDVELPVSKTKTAKDVQEWSNDLGFEKLQTYCLKGQLDKAKHWSYVLDEEIIKNPPDIRNPPHKDRIPAKCKNCNKNGHLVNHCEEICTKCIDPSCEKIPTHCKYWKDDVRKCKDIEKARRVDPGGYGLAVQYSWSLLMIACYGGQLDVVKWLVEDNECDVNVGSLDGYTPVMCATMKGHLAVYEYLKEKGADLMKVNRYGENCVTISVNKGWNKDPKIKDKYDNKGKIPYQDVVQALCGEDGPYEVLGREKLGVRNRKAVTTMFNLGGVVPKERFRYTIDEQIPSLGIGMFRGKHDPPNVPKEEQTEEEGKS